MIVVTPFSSWKADSVNLVKIYIRSNYSVAVLTAGVILTWRECKMLMRVLALSGVTLILCARLVQKIDSEGRLNLQSGTIQNSNDLAAVLILVLPFVLWYVLAGRYKILRLAALPIMGLAGSEILHSGSRGALVAIGVTSLFYLWKASSRQRIAFLALVPFAAAALVAVAPSITIRRMLAFSEDDAGPNAGVVAEALESSDMRKELLKKSIEYSFSHPLTGVGPGQFANFEGQHNLAPGQAHGMWHNPHNIFTEVSSECGFPAFGMFTAAIVSTLGGLLRTFKEARRRPDCEDIRMVAFCFSMGMIGFLTAITFLNFAYLYYLPTLTGLAVAVVRAARSEMDARERRSVSEQVVAPLPRRAFAWTA